MKYIVFTFLLCGIFRLQAQTPPNAALQFINPAYDLEDHWVAFPKNPATGKYPFGFIYLDTQAGFTFNLEGFFQFDARGTAYRDSTDFLKNAMQKIRLASNMPTVAIIPDKILSELKMDPIPAWLSIYKRDNADRNSVSMKVIIGRHLNAAGAPKKALEYLESAYLTEPHAAGLEFEISYSYNKLGHYEKSIKILNDAIVHTPNNTIFYKELGYAYMKSKDFEKASKAFTDGIEISKKDRMNQLDEMAYNLSAVYYEVKQYDKAISTLTDAIGALPKSLQLYIQLAVIYKAAGDPDNAIKTYMKVVEFTPTSQMEQRAQLAWSIALIYRDKKKDVGQYSEWGKKAKEWAPVGSKAEQFLRSMTF